MEDVRLFTNEDFGELRTVEQDGRVLFCAKDVAAALGYVNTNKAIGDHCKGVPIRYPLETAGGIQEVRFITEGDVYRLIAHSKLDGAQRFESWVFDEVLPAIRRTGGYMAAGPDETPELILARAVLVANDTIERQKAQISDLTEDNARMLPKATMYDVAIEAEGTMTVTQAARYLGQLDRAITQRKLFARLRADELLCKQSNAPTRYAIDHGYMVQVLSTRGDGKANAPYARITRKGLDWCVEHYCAATRIEGVA